MPDDGRDAAEELYESLIAPIEKRMMATVARVVGDPEDAEDAFQEALVTVWRKLSRIHRHANPQAYILRICLSRAYDMLRKRERRRKHEIAVDPEIGEFLSEKAASDTRPGMAGRAIRSALATLSARQAQAVVLRLIEGEDYEGIARILACSETTARSHVSKGRARLRAKLEDMGIGRGSRAPTPSPDPGAPTTRTAGESK
jgi:RNA polymerase sigma-70 factor (ECF subfamily)